MFDTKRRRTTISLLNYLPAGLGRPLLVLATSHELKLIYMVNTMDNVMLCCPAGWHYPSAGRIPASIAAFEVDENISGRGGSARQKHSCSDIPAHSQNHRVLVAPM